MKYRIAWVNNVNGRNGVGTKEFTLEEVTALVAELNEEYPDITHEARSVDGPMDPPPVTEHLATAHAAPAPAPKLGPLELSDKDPFPFGPKFKGVPMKDVPASYLDWLRGQPWIGNWTGVANYIERNKRAINQDLQRKERRA